ncbi:hypothetical protein [Labilibaculum antarcticum]|uniref:Uncharacterized protein n=1 Tax=Labilibaculum antarcticum TaxID=1717717 RepID=A0A1Y1CH70_9BACT|nr:hypothetical protein [Labilibaculum antarcticum]BAX78641.1 hypothetical protein ALGA_0246 [Labilibaculum antarcticum]
MCIIEEVDINNKLNNEIQIIVNESIKLVSDSLLAIVLYGSYGRGEGAFFSDEEGKIRTYNDFDIILVVSDLLEQEIINEISNTLSDKLDVKWIDISQKSKKTLKNLKLSIFNYDFKYGSRVIYGDNLILEDIPKFQNIHLSLKEAETLYFTRIWTFLGSLPKNGFESGVSGEDSRFFKNQMAKAILAIVDIVLLQKKCYDTSYRKRVELINNTCQNKPDLIKWSNWAIKEKCRPSGNKLSPLDVETMYSEIANIFLVEMFHVLSIYYKKKINCSKDIESSLRFSFSEFVVTTKLFLKNKRLKYIKNKKIGLAQSYLLEAYIKEGKQKVDLINKSKKIVKSIDSSIDLRKLDWNELRLLVSELRMYL